MSFSKSPGMGPILLLFRSQNGPHTGWLKDKLSQLEKPAFIEIHFSLPIKVGQTRSERRSFAAVSGV